MHSIKGGHANAPTLVCLPGDGAGAAFYFRNFPSLCQHFRVYAVDLLGNGMSGALFPPKSFATEVLHCAMAQLQRERLTCYRAQH